MHFHTTSFRGIGPVTTQELRERFERAVRDITAYRVRDYDITSFSTEIPVTNLMQMGTTEDLFCRIGLTDLTGKQKDLADLQETMRGPALQSALAIHTDMGSGRSPKRTSFRVVSQAESAPWRSYRRRKMEEAVATGIQDRFRNWRHAEDDANLEFWVQQAEKKALISLRLSTAR